MERNRVLVSGLPEEKHISRSDLMIYFQSKKKSGGEEVSSLEILGQGQAILTFESEVAAQRVLAKEHTIHGHNIETTVPQASTRSKAPEATEEEIEDVSSEESSYDDDEPEDPEEICAIQVKDLSPITTKDSIQNYFENKKKSKGGPVRKVELKSSLNMAIVVFRLEQDAKSVLMHSKHKLDNARLNVSLLYTKQKEETLPIKAKQDSTSDITSGNEVPLEFLVSGISESTTEDSLINYLENTRRSGAGEVKMLTFDTEDGTAEIKLQNVKNLEQLLGGHHKIDGSTIKIEVKEPEKEVPMDPLKAHVKGLNPETSKDGVELYIEKMSEREINSVQFGTYGNALICFTETPDFDQFARKMANNKKGLEGFKPTLERVPYCCCLQVSGLDPKTTEDAIKLYFENPKKGCGAEPSEIKLLGQGKALVHFDDSSVIDQAFGKQHYLDKTELKLEMFYPFLTEENVPNKKHKKGREMTEIEIDPDVMDYICKNCFDELQELQDETDVELEWIPEEKFVKLKGKRSATNKNEPWAERVKVLQVFLEAFGSLKISVEASLWSEVLEGIKKESSVNDLDDIDVKIIDSTNELKIIGRKERLQMAIKVVKILIDGIKEDRAMQDSVITKVEEDIESGKLALLKISDLYEKLQGISKHVKININEAKGELIMQGPRGLLQEISVETFKFFTKIKEEVLELPERVLKVLQTPKGSDFVTSALSKNDILAVLVLGQRKNRNEASIFAINKDQAREASKLIQSFSTERSIRLHDENIPVIKSQQVNELVADLENRLMVNVLFEAQSQTLWVSGIEPDVTKCYTVVERHIEKNTILNDIVEVTDGCSRFIFQRFDKEIEKLQNDLSDSFLAIRPSDGGEILLTGTHEGIDKGKEKLMSFVESVCEEEIKVDKPGMRKFFKSSQGSKLIRAIENENKCAVELVDLEQLAESKPNSLIEIDNSKRLSNGEIICSYTTKQGKKVIVYKDDLTKHKVDVIVNAANEDLQHVGGLAGAIAREGGKEIQDECNTYTAKNGSLLEGQVLETGPGNLPCKRILHAVGPRWETYGERDRRKHNTSNKERYLRFAFENCLNTAKNYHSIAIPAVSSGIFGFPLDLCASILVDTVINFFERNSGCKLSEVHLTNNDDKTVNAFLAEMKNKYGEETSFIEGKHIKSSFVSMPKMKPSSRSTAASLQEGLFSTPEGISILVKVGDIAQEKADVLVNTAGEGLNLQNNACARSFSNAAGPKLQAYCNTISPVGVGDIGITKPGRLDCRYVFHAVCGEWKGGKGNKILRDILKECLTEADKRGASSIAIPAIGTGILQFPRNVVAQVSFEEVLLFSKTQPSTLKEVRFVVYNKDQLTAQAFKEEISNRLQSPRNFRSSKKTASRKSIKTLATGNSTLRKRKENWYEIDVENISVQVQSGDITKESTDAIVVVSNSELDISYGGGAGAAILNAGGDAIRRECQRHQLMGPGKVAITTAGKLDVSKLIHYVPVSSSFNEAQLTTAVFDCLNVAEQSGLNSISFPAIGTGNLGVTPDRCAKAMLTAFSEFSKQKPTAVQLIRIVIFQDSMIKDFYSKMMEFVGEVPVKKESPSFFRRLTNYVGITTEQDKEVDHEVEYYESSEIILRVFCGLQTDLDVAVKAIRDMVNEKCKRQVINNDIIAHMDQNHLRKIRTLERRFDCKIQVEISVCRITVQGNNEDVLGAMSAIHDILHKVTEEVHERKQAEYIAKDIQWQYETDNGFESYSNELNAKIEEAHISGKKSVTFKDGDEELKIIFSRMMEDDGRNETRVTRKRLSGNDITLPDYWDPQPKDKSGKTEVTVHLVNLDTKKHRQEYLKVSDHFKATIAGRNLIKKIQRVQNPGQYKIYAVKKQLMDEKNGSNEMMLFHGTTQQSCDNINHTGFNRSYGGRNATMYGRGVYFAVNAEYSARSTYSPPDTQGNRYMYLARVLTGEYTVGDQTMAFAPPKDPSNLTVTYDTVVDDMAKPEIFVAFYDWQCYPEYLITFQ